MTSKHATILAAVFLLGCFVFGGIYTSSSGVASVFVVNRFTGSVQACGAGSCQPMGERAENTTGILGAAEVAAMASNSGE